MKESLKGKGSVPHLKTGDFVRIKDSVKIHNMNELARVHDTLGEPPYVFLEKAADHPHFGVEVFIRSHDQRSHPVRVLTSEGGSDDDAVHVYESGVIQIPLSFLEKVIPPRHELTIGKVVHVDLELLATLVQPFQYEAIRGKYGNKTCVVHRIIEADDVHDPTHTHYFAILGIRGVAKVEHPLSVPIEALVTEH